VRRWSRMDGNWEVVTRPPHPLLRPGVRGYRGFRLEFERSRLRLEVPNGSVTLVLGFGDPVRILGRAGDAGRTALDLTAALAAQFDRIEGQVTSVVLAS
jgi:hypothetical protein